MVDYITELLVDNEWLNITPDVRDSSPITLERGRRDWASDTDPATCSLKLNNGLSRAAAGVSGRYSPRNPRSDLFGKIGRNTQLRIRKDETPELFMELPGVDGSNASTPDASGVDITGTIDIRIEVEPETWRPEYYKVLASKWSTVNDQRSWLWSIGGETGGVSGRLEFRWSTDGAAWFGETASVRIPEDSTRLALRVTRNTTTGDVIFYTSDSLTGTWTQLGSTQAGTAAAHFNSSAPLVVGQADDTGTSYTAFQGKVYGFRLRSGIGGTVVTDPDFDEHEPEVRSFVDNQPRVWTLNDSATFVNPSVRFTGEAKSWPPQWDLSGADHWVNLTAAGITRRLQRGKKPLKSSMFRDLSVDPGIVAYWPMEEPRGATEFTSGLPGISPALAPLNDDEVTFAADDGVFYASGSLPTVGDTSIAGSVPSYSAAAYQRFGFLIAIPVDAPWTTDKVVARVYTSGTARKWDIVKLAAPSLNAELRSYDADDAVLSTDTVALPLMGVPAHLSLLLHQDGSAVDWEIALTPLDGSTTSGATGSLASNTFGRMTRVVLGTSNGTGMEDTIFGQAHIWNRAEEPFWDETLSLITGWARETGLERLIRLSSDEGLPPVRAIGLNDDHREPFELGTFPEWAPPETITEKMGPQSRATLMALFREVSMADLGILTDRPDAVGLQYRSRIDLYNQEPTLTLDYSNGIIDQPFRPVDDDQNIVNEITVERPRGSSFTAADTTGPLSSLDPPDGVGLYDESQEINVESDDRLPDQAYWRLHLGTIDEARFPVLSLNLRNPRVAELEDDILSLREGDLIRIENPPENLPGGPYDLLVEAIHEEKTAVTHQIEFACSPGSAWRVFMLDDAGEASRLDTGGSSLAEALTPTQVTFDVATDAGSQRWIEAGSISTEAALVLPGDVTSYASTPDAAALDITGDIDIRIRVAPNTWTPGEPQCLASKFDVVGSQNSWLFRIDTSGTLTIFWSTNGSSNLSRTSSIAVSSPGEGVFLWLRVTLEVAVGGVNHRVTFYTSEDGVTWDPLGSQATIASTTSIFSGSAPVVVGQDSGGTTRAFNGNASYFELRSGVAGAVVTNPDFSAESPGTTSFADSTGKTWTVQGDAEIADVTTITPTDDPFQIMVGGEVMEVENITGTSSPQEFIVRRAVNGVAKSHTVGTDVRLATPYFISL